METGFEPVYTDLQSVASPLGHSTGEDRSHPEERDPLRADDGIRTRDPHLGKVMLYQLSHVRTLSDQAFRLVRRVEHHIRLRRAIAKRGAVSRRVPPPRFALG